MYRQVFQNHPLGQINYTSIDTITEADLIRGKDEHFHPDHLVMALVGAIPKGAEDAIGQTFGSLPRKGLQKTKFSMVPQKSEVVTEEVQTSSSSVCVGWAVPGLETVNQTFQFYFLEHLLAGSRGLYTYSSRLYDGLISRMGLGYSVTADYSAFRGCGLFQIYVDGISNGSSEKVKASLRRQVDRLRTEQISQQEFEIVRETLKVGEWRNSHHSDSSFAKSLALNAVDGLPTDFGFFAKQADSLTPRDIMNAAQRNLNGQHVTVELVGTGN